MTPEMTREDLLFTRWSDAKSEGVKPETSGA